MAIKRILYWQLSLMLLAAVATQAWAQESAKPATRTEFEKVEATIESIDAAKREVTLRGAEGPVSIVVGPEARNFDQLRVGDKVIVSYYRGIAAQMSKNGTKVTEPAQSTFAYRAERGKKPGGGVGGSVTATVTIEEVNPEANTVAFRTSSGQVHVIAVESPEMQQFARTLKPGDSVDVTYTESVAVNVVPVPEREAESKQMTPPP